MSDSFLSQEEIDALLRSEAPSQQTVEPLLSDMERDALGEIGNMSMGSAATTLSVLLNKTVQITTPQVAVTKLDQLRTEYPLPYLIIEVKYTEGIPGTNLLAIHERDAAVIADLMMGNDGVSPPAEISEIYMSAVSEAMNQMMGTTATSLSNIFKKRVEIGPPKVGLINMSEGEPMTDSILPSDNVVKISFRMEIGDLVDSEIMLILPLNLARSMVDGLLHADTPPTNAAAPAPAPAPQAAHSTASRVASPTPAYAPPPPAMSRTIPEQHVSVQPAQFAPLRQTTIHAVDSNIEMIMDVSLQVTVELGRTRKLIREILELAPGSVVELDKLAGEPVDILVNGKIVAKGEVVVIDENFGVRITGIVSQQERATTLQ